MQAKTTAHRTGNLKKRLFVSWWFNVTATCQCISATDPLRLAISPSLSIPTSDHPVPATTLHCQGLETRIPVFEVTGVTRHGKAPPPPSPSPAPPHPPPERAPLPSPTSPSSPPGKAGFEPVSAVFEADTLLLRHRGGLREVCLLVGCLTSQQHVSVSQGRVC